MDDLLPFLKSLLSSPGISGSESTVMQLIRQEWTPLVDEIRFSRVGSLHGLKRGIGHKPRPSLLLAAHMDAIGLMVSRISEGFLHISAIGGIDARILPGVPVLVHGKKPLPGVIVQPAVNLLPEDHSEFAAQIETLVVDTGLLPRQVNQNVKVGDWISFDTSPIELEGGILSGHSLDNRISVGALTACLKIIKETPPAWDVWALASVQEEINFGGATTSAFDLQPDLAVVLDTTFGKSPSSDGWQTFDIGKAPTLGLGANIHPYLHRRFKELAEWLEIPCEIEPMPASSGTDAMAIQVSRIGIPCMVICIPIRYMHTPVEMAALKDVHLVSRLLAEFIKSLELDDLNKVVWED